MTPAANFATTCVVDTGGKFAEKAQFWPDPSHWTVSLIT
jgi:hypothetical protein